MIQLIKDTFRLLTFQTTREEFLAFDRKHLIFGLICTWIVGIGRYWDNSEAGFLQHLGIGSVVYIFVLTLFLLLFIAPLKTENLSYKRLLIFISLVSPPAVLYAVPVEKFMDMGSANAVNAWFLFVVAAWRVALLFFALIRFFKMDVLSAVSATFLPLGLIVLVLSGLNLEHVVFNIMGGFREPSSPNESAYGVLVTLVFLAVLLSPIFFVLYVIQIVRSQRETAKIDFDDKD